jgi:hypothetical protein
MIGVLAKDREVRAVHEFFELFKTPWEFYASNHDYELVMATAEDVPEEVNARVLVVYNSRPTAIDEQFGIVAESTQNDKWVEWQDAQWPVYGNLTTLRGAGPAIVRQRQSGETVGIKVLKAGRQTIRIGIDLFGELTFLLNQGQPPENAHVPTLDLHIALLRTIMLTSGISFIEIPPRPSGYDFMACLTHDVDFVGLRDHKFDHTMFGFIYRTFAGSLGRALRGQLSWSKCWQNWKAGLSLPLVHLGLRDDFWIEFDRYLQIEREFGSTFFFIPFKNVPGTRNSHSAPKRRAAKYDVGEMKGQVVELARHGSEVGLHGIDAWQNVEKADVELRRIREVSGQTEMGVRMHWLYWTESSPQTLEKAGFTYDSTFGYNDVVGFRAGTCQAFCPLGVATLLELPLSIQDTALFYPDRMKLSEAEALNVCKRLIHYVSCYGGALTVNWHTRSLSSERLWGGFYAMLLEEIQTRRVWFGTAKEIVHWFRTRRALRFESVQFGENSVRLVLNSEANYGKLPLTLRIHHPHFKSSESEFHDHMPVCSDVQWNGDEVLEIAYAHLDL